MEIGAIGQSHKPALLQGGYAAPTQNADFVGIAWPRDDFVIFRGVAKAELSEPTVVIRAAEDHQPKATPGITGW